jgi:quinol monooxygenase YgiN
MFIVVWEFKVKPEHVPDFEQHYAADGTWAKLFREDPAYQQTILMRDSKTPDRYLTSDFWRDARSYHSFQQRARARYQELDAAFAVFTSSEALIGHFEVPE